MNRIGGLPASVTLLADVEAHEGPVYVAEEDALYVTTPRSALGTKIIRIALAGMAPVGRSAVTVVPAGTVNANGMALGPDGRLVVCDQGSMTSPARICLVDRVTGHTETLVDSIAGTPLNSPNDVVVARDGAVWFTDPAYGALQGFRPAPLLSDAVYRHDRATGTTEPIGRGLDKPNGLAFSPGQDVLYVGDSGADRGDGTFEPDRPHEVVRFAVGRGGQVRLQEVFAVTTPGAPDGILVDERGWVYVTTGAGIAVHEPDGQPVGHVDLPGAVNMTFAGVGVLLVTADTALWAVTL